MSQASCLISVNLSLPNDITPEEKEDAISQLRRELLETDVDSVESDTDASAPAGAKGLPPGLDTLLITLAGSGSVLGAVIKMIAGWSSDRKGTATVKFNGHEFTFTNLGLEDQHALVARCMATLSEEKS
jgi:Effector Associated Constant Component 1